MSDVIRHDGDMIKIRNKCNYKIEHTFDKRSNKWYSINDLREGYYEVRECNRKNQ
jgi:hypothetical protein